MKMGWTSRSTRRRGAIWLLLLWGLHLGAPLLRASEGARDAMVLRELATGSPGEGAPSRKLGEYTGQVLGAGFGAASALSGSLVGATGSVAAVTSRQIREAAGEVYDDVMEGRLRWVVGPARNAVMIAPQVHTAARNTRNAYRASMAERRAAQGWKRYGLQVPKDWKAPVTPTRQVVARQFATPFSPTNVLLTVGLTVAGGMVVAAQEEDVTWRDALAMAGDRSLWVAMVTSGVGYAIASLAAAALLPTGAGLIPLLAPVVVGTVGAIVGWIVGEKVANGASVKEAFESLSLGSIVGLSVGAVVGVLAGVAVGAVIGGPVGAAVGPLAAVAGTLLFRKLGTRWGEATEASLQEAADETYRRLIDALDAGRTAEAREHLADLKEIQEELEKHREEAAASPGAPGSE